MTVKLHVWYDSVITESLWHLLTATKDVGNKTICLLSRMELQKRLCK